jgi:hypothetical protein
MGGGWWRSRCGKIGFLFLDAAAIFAVLAVAWATPPPAGGTGAAPLLLQRAREQKNQADKYLLVK